jgi:hypothetical protein
MRQNADRAMAKAGSQQAAALSYRAPPTSRPLRVMQSDGVAVRRS